MRKDIQVFPACGSCGARGPGFHRLKSGLLRCPRCFIRLQEWNRDALEAECGVCVWPRLPIELPRPALASALPAPTSQDTVTADELEQREQARARRIQAWKDKGAAVDVKARQAVES